MNNLQYITEKMGIEYACPHWSYYNPYSVAKNAECKHEKCYPIQFPPTYSPEFFFEVWNWAIKQDWWQEFLEWYFIDSDIAVDVENPYFLIHETRFIDAVADYLRSKA